MGSVDLKLEEKTFTSGLQLSHYQLGQQGQTGWITHPESMEQGGRTQELQVKTGTVVQTCNPALKTNTGGSHVRDQPAPQRRLVLA